MSSRARIGSVALVVALVVGMSLGVVSPAIASPGDLDTTFGGDGKVMTAIDPGPAEANGVAIQADGKIVTVGSNDLFEGDSNRFAITRYNPDGTLDTTFGGDGIVTTNFTPHDDHAFDVAIQTDGKIVVAGYAGDQVQRPNPDWNKLKVALARYNPDGSLDPTFGGDGKVLTSVGPGDDYARGVALQPDGKIVAIGYSAFDSACCNYNYKFTLTRYNPDGTLDQTFGIDGKVATDFTPRSDFAIDDAVQADGKIVAVGVSGYLGLGGDDARFALARYNADGSLDTTFGGDGKVTTDFTPFRDGADSVAIQADGRIVASGSAGIGGPNSTFALARYNVDGSLDSTFGADGRVTTDFTRSGLENRSAVAVQADGRIVAAGAVGFKGGDGNGRFGLARYNIDGTLDATFGGDGMVTANFTPYDDTPAALAIAADGEIVAAGVSGIGSRNAKLALARFLSA